MGILDTIAAQAAKSAAAQAAPATTEQRKSSKVWLNVGVVIPGAGEDGSDLFVSLPNAGIPLDDVKPVRVNGTNQHSIQLKQVKNMLLDELQKLGESMQPGERRRIPLTTEIYRVAEPDQQGDAATNPLIAGLFNALRG